MLTYFLVEGSLFGCGVQNRRHGFAINYRSRKICWSTNATKRIVGTVF